MLTVEKLKHSLLFKNGTINGTDALVSLEIKLAPNEVTTMTLELSHDIGVGFKDNVDLSFGYQSADQWTLPPTLSVGSTGPNVVLLEGLLKEHGLITRNPASTYDTTTENAVRFLQQWYNITPLDGICGPMTWPKAFRNSSYTSIEPGRFYVDSYRRTNETFTLDALAFNFLLYQTNSPYQQTGYALMDCVDDVGHQTGYDSIINFGSTFLVGTTDTTAGTVVNRSSTSAMDLLFETGRKFAHFHYVWGDKIHSRYFGQFWSEPSIPIVADTDLLELERIQSTIDTVRVVDSVKWKSPSAGQFTPSTVSYVEYGSTDDLRDEGFYHDSTSALYRLRGHIVERTKNVRACRIKTYGRLGNAWLPGRCISVGNQDGTSSRWVIREHVYNYGPSGFTSTMTLQWPQI